jgi:hypothetical protein
MAIKRAKVVIPAETGIAFMPDEGLQKDPGFRRDDRNVGLLGCCNNKRPVK